MENKMKYNQGKVYIFDIDGCIMPNVFPIIGDTEVKKRVEYCEIMEKLSRTSLYPEFVEYYKSFCAESLVVYFLTGRKRKRYEVITKAQLKPIESYKNYRIFYYPDHQSHTLKRYITWKVKIIKNIMKRKPFDFAEFHIFDDLEALFPMITNEIFDFVNYYCNLVKSNSDWICVKNIDCLLNKI